MPSIDTVGATQVSPAMMAMGDVDIIVNVATLPGR
jgi:hypothetical protein